MIDPLISATVIEKKSGKKEFRVKEVDAHELKIKEQKFNKLCFVLPIVYNLFHYTRTANSPNNFPSECSVPLCSQKSG